MYGVAGLRGVPRTPLHPLISLTLSRRKLQRGHMSRARRPRPARTRALGVVGTSSGAPSRCSWSRPTIHQREPTGVDQLAAGCSSCRAARFSPIAEQSASEGVLENEGFSSWLLNSMADTARVEMADTLRRQAYDVVGSGVLGGLRRQRDGRDGGHSRGRV